MMNLRVTLLAALLLVSPCLAGAQEAKTAAAESAEQETVGVFAGIEQGDYFYIKVQDAAGEEHSYMILDDGNGLKQFVDKPKKFLGKRIRVRWQEKEIEIPEAGGKMKMNVALGAERLK